MVCAGAQADPALDARLRALEEELRCLVCQNQTLADSSAPLAEDLRREVRELAVAGKSDEEIKQYLVARYGDFVLYRPPVKSTTWLLWFGPFVLLAGGGVHLVADSAPARPQGRDDDDDFPAAGDDAAKPASRRRASCSTVRWSERAPRVELRARALTAIRTSDGLRKLASSREGGDPAAFIESPGFPLSRERRFQDRCVTHLRRLDQVVDLRAEAALPGAAASAGGCARARRRHRQPGDARGGGRSRSRSAPSSRGARPSAGRSC